MFGNSRLFRQAGGFRISVAADKDIADTCDERRHGSHARKDGGPTGPPAILCRFFASQHTIFFGVAAVCFPALQDHCCGEEHARSVRVEEAIVLAIFPDNSVQAFICVLGKIRRIPNLSVTSQRAEFPEHLVGLASSDLASLLFIYEEMCPWAAASFEEMTAQATSRWQVGLVGIHDSMLPSRRHRSNPGRGGRGERGWLMGNSACQFELASGGLAEAGLIALLLYLPQDGRVDRARQRLAVRRWRLAFGLAVALLEGTRDDGLKRC